RPRRRCRSPGVCPWPARRAATPTRGARFPTATAAQRRRFSRSWLFHAASGLSLRRTVPRSRPRCAPYGRAFPARASPPTPLPAIADSSPVTGGRASRSSTRRASRTVRRRLRARSRASRPRSQPSAWTAAASGSPGLIPSRATAAVAGGRGVLAETLIGVIGALAVLAFVFGSLLAFVPLLVAAVAIPTCFLIIWGIASLTQVFFIVQYLVALIGLGVAIDYSLLIVVRWREELARGADNLEPVKRAMTTAGHAVFFSGSTVAVSLLALLALPVPFLRSVGYAGMLIPLISVAVALTLLPVLLATVGPRLDWPHRRRDDRA